MPIVSTLGPRGSTPGTNDDVALFFIEVATVMGIMHGPMLTPLARETGKCVLLPSLSDHQRLDHRLRGVHTRSASTEPEAPRSFTSVVRQLAKSKPLGLIRCTSLRPAACT